MLEESNGICSCLNWSELGHTLQLWSDVFSHVTIT